MNTISTLLFLVACRPSRIHIVSNYFSSIIELLLKLSTMCKSPLHGPCNYADGTWGLSANSFLSLYQGFQDLRTWCVSRERKCKQENPGAFMPILKQRMEVRHRAKKGKILFSCVTILHLEELYFFIR